MKFVDYVTITIRSGSGGPGCVAFRREKFVPKGGPAGGDGGDGGSIWLKGDSNLYTLLDLRYQRHHFAENGRPGEGSNRKGRDGEDIVIRVPPGTIARDRNTEEVIGEVLEDGSGILLAQGGRGGRGNAFFKSATRQAPRVAQPGKPGEEREVALELRLLADVGLVGFPNAGKSTLISSLSEAKPKVAEYPFTTLTPQLGVVRVADFESFVMADIPGLIEGAHEGRGLGIQFLKHIERNAALLYVLPLDGPPPDEQYEVLASELAAFNSELLDKPFLVGISKTDLIPESEREERSARHWDLPDEQGVVAFSAVTGHGLNELRRTLWQMIRESQPPDS